MDCCSGRGEAWHGTTLNPVALYAAVGHHVVTSKLVQRTCCDYITGYKISKSRDLDGILSVPGVFHDRFCLCSGSRAEMS